MKKPMINGRAAYMRNVMLGEYTESNDPPFNGRQFLNKVYGEIPTEMYKAANLNLTFDGSYEITGNYDKNGLFDGIIGLVQKNITDFSVFSVPLESFQGISTDEMPVKIIRMTGEDEFYIMSHPTYQRNTSMIHYDIEDSFMELNLEVIILYAVLFALFHMLIRKVFPLIHCKQNRSGGDLKNDKGVGWNMIRLVFNQGSTIHLNLPTQVCIFFAFECCIGILLCLFQNHMSSDLVAYRKPKLLDTLQDVWDSGDEYKTSFTSQASVASRLKLFDEGSTERKIVDNHYKVWKPLEGIKKDPKDGKAVYLPTLGSEEFMDSGWLIKKRKLSFLAHYISVGIILGFECKGIGRIDPKEEGTPPKESSLYVSKNPFMIQHAVHVVNWNINPELERRLAYYHDRLLDHGIDNLVFKEGGAMVYENLPIGGKVSIQCMNRKEWDDSDKEPTAFGLDSCKRFLLHICAAFIPGIVTFAIEMTWGKVMLEKNRSKMEWKVCYRCPNETLVRVRKRRMKILEEARSAIRDGRDMKI